jgi:hypothetical protein
MPGNEKEAAEAARSACENASVSGLCALGAIAALDLNAVLAALPAREDTP